MTKITSGSYRPGEEHPDWKQALQAVPTDAHDWLQVRMGQAITGLNHKAVGLMRGGGENGKSLAFGTGIMRAAGDYATVAAPGVLAKVDEGSPAPDRMDLRGARIVLIEEMTEGRALDMTALKQLQDVDRIRARQLYKDNVYFDLTHSLFITSNYLPVVNEVDHGVWRRLERIEFPYRFRDPCKPHQTKMDRTGDPDLKDRLKANESGQHDAIVTWLVEGAIRWYADKASASPPRSCATTPPTGGLGPTASTGSGSSTWSPIPTASSSRMTCSARSTTG